MHFLERSLFKISNFIIRVFFDCFIIISFIINRIFAIIKVDFFEYNDFILIFNYYFNKINTEFINLQFKVYFILIEVSFKEV